MNLVQISTSPKHGAYYCDPSAGEVYHVPYEDLPELNNVRMPSFAGGLIGGLAVSIGMVGYAKDLRYNGHSLAPLLLLLVLIFTSCLVFGLVKGNQKRISRSIREQYHPVCGELDLSQIMRYGQKLYVQIAVYSVFLFTFTVLSLCISVAEDSVLFALFSIVFFDTGVMVLVILQPVGKLKARSKLKKGNRRR